MAAASPLRRELVKGLLVALPLALAQSLMLHWVGSFSDNPWGVAALLLPLGVAAWVLGRPLYRQRRLVLGGGSLAFFFVYCLVFSLAAGTESLNGRRLPLAGFEREVPTNFLGLSRLGDWRYLVAPEADAARDVVVVTFPSFGGVETWKARRTHADLVALATRVGAKGVAFDFSFPPARSASDLLAPVMNQALCGAIATAADAGIPVILGIDVDVSAGQLVPQPLPEELQACVAAERRGSLFGYQESDGRVRMVPLYLGGDEEHPALSYRAAERLARGALEPPTSGLLQFVRPHEGPLVLEAEMNPDTGGVASLTPAGGPSMDLESAARLLSGRFVFVGSAREEDVMETPYGEQLGVVVHAWAAHGLRSGQSIERLRRVWTFPMIFVLCFLLTAAQAGGGGRRALVRGAGLLSLTVLVSAVAAMRFGLVWMDVSYPLAAIWLLAGVLMGGAAWQSRRVGARPVAELGGISNGEEPAAGGPFDVFLSHNSREKPLVLELGEALKRRGLRVWLDAWELVPGRPWQEGLEDVIETVRSAAVLVGAEGMGPWEEPEMRACLDQLVKRRMAVIPVLLPGAGESPDLPLFLRGLTWVDLRAGLTENNLDRLEWGITGVKPARRRATAA